ncbi:MAG: glycosyltransferase family 39 protein, partial [Anaerolineales bacterium]
MKRPLPWTALATLGVLLLAAALRFYRLDAQSLWNDEGTSAALALRSLRAIAHDAANDIHPPLYYWILAGWVRLAGTSEFALRSLSALMGVGVVGLTIALGRRWFERETALLAGLLAAISPFAVYYAQEARMYTQVTLCGAAAIFALTHALPTSKGQTPLRWPALLAYALAMLATLYSHYYGAALLLACNLAFVAWLALRWRETPPDSRGALWRWVLVWAATQAAILACYVPWLAYAWHTIRDWPSISAPFTLGQLALRLAQVLPLGITVETTAWTLAAGVALALMAALGLLRPAHETGSAAQRWWPVIAAALYAAVPLGLMYAASLRRPMYNPKFLLLATPGYLLLLARGIVTLAGGARRLAGPWASRVTGAVALVAVLAPLSGSLYALYTDPAFYRDDYRGIVAYIEATAGPADAVLVNAPSQVETVDYYYDGPWPVYPLPETRPADRAATEARLADILAQHERLYAIYWATEESDPEGIVEGYLASHAFTALDAWHGNIRLVVYDSAREAPREPAVPTDYALGQAIALDGYALLTPRLTAGDVAQVTLFWRATQPITGRYKVFVHLVDAGGSIVGQHDAEPVAGSRPTDSWTVGERVADNHGILVQPGTPPGTLTLRVGLYDSTTGLRLPVRTSEGPVGDAIDLAELPLAAPVEPLPLAAFDVETPVEATVGGSEILGYSLYPLGLRH